MKLSILAGLLIGCSVVGLNAAPLSLSELNGILASSERPAKDSERDGARKPAEVMQFAGIEAGDHILDLFAGGGWYSELFSMAVGPTGKVYAQNDNVIPISIRS